MKIIKLIFFLLLFLLIGGVTYLAYLGFIPIVSNVMRVMKPKDLGIKYNRENYESYVKKAKTEIKYVTNNSDPAKSIKASGIKILKNNFSQEEISARLNYSNWKYMPIKNTQVKIGEDGTVEFSGNLIPDRFQDYIDYSGWLKFSNLEIFQKLKYLDLIKTNPPIYIKFSGKAIHNYSTIQLESIKIGGYSLPLAELEKSKMLPLIIQNVILKVNGFHIMSVKFSGGQMIFDGTVPAKMEVESN